jgi:hypothetical protein
VTKEGRPLPGLDTPSSFDVDFRRRVCRGALVAGLFGLALACALASRAAAVGTTATASDMTASALSTRSTVTLESSPESQGPATPEPAPSAEPQGPATPEPAPSAEPQGPATPEPAPSAEPQEPATPEPAPSAEPQEPATPEPAPRAEPQEPATPEPTPRAEPQTAFATAPTATDPASIVTQTKAASPPAARAVRRAPRRPATPSTAGPRPAAAGRLPFALPPYVDVSSLPALARRASSRGPAAAANQPTKRRRAEGTDDERGPHSPLGPLDGTFHAASSATSGGGAAPDLFWCIIVLGLAAYRPQALRRHRVRQVARRLVGFSSLHAQPG